MGHIMKKILNINVKKFFGSIIAVFLIFSLFFSAVSSTDSTENELDSNKTDRASTHTVFVEYGTAQFCGPCASWSPSLHSMYNSGDYDFEYVTMVFLSWGWSDINNQDAYNWATLYGITGGPVPTNIMDGDYQRSTSSVSEFQTEIPLCENRVVKDITANLDVYWLGDATIQVDISILNNEATEYFEFQ